MKDFFKLKPYITGLATGVLIVSVFVVIKNVNSSSQKQSLKEYSRSFSENSREDISGSRLKRQSEMLGITQEELQKEIDSGKSFREIAKEKGIDPTSFKKEYKDNSTINNEATLNSNNKSNTETNTNTNVN